MASFGVAVLATVLAMGMGSASASSDPSTVQAAYNTVFSVGAVCAGIATVLAFFLPGRKRNRQLREERATEYGEAMVAEAV